MIVARVYVCVRACVCVRPCACVCARACVRVSARVCKRVLDLLGGCASCEVCVWNMGESAQIAATPASTACLLRLTNAIHPAQAGNTVSCIMGQTNCLSQVIIYLLVHAVTWSRESYMKAIHVSENRFQTEALK